MVVVVHNHPRGLLSIEHRGSKVEVNLRRVARETIYTNTTIPMGV